jgi:uncharacterized protein (TIGR03437 family)
MRLWSFGVALLFALSAGAQAPIVQPSDPINLRNFALNADGTEVVYIASLNRFAEREGLGNIYSAVLAPQPTTTRLTSYQDDNSYLGVTALDLAAASGKIVYSLLANFLNQVEEIRLLDSDGDHLIATDKDGCVRIQCVNCYSTCVRNVHITADGGTVLYAAARNQPFTVVTLTPGITRRLDVYEGTLAPSGQRVISQAGKIVFSSSAPFGPTFAAQATDVYTMNLNGSSIQQVTHLSPATSVASDAVIAANGSWIAFTRSDPTVKPQIWVVKPDGTSLHPVSVASTGATGPSISADGSTVSFLQDGQVKQAATAIDPLALFRVVDVTKFAVSAAQNAILSADGRRAVFMLGPPGGLPASIYSGPVEGVEKFEQLSAFYAPRFLFSGGVVSAGGTAPPSVGSLMTAYGANLSALELSLAPSLPLPTQLGGIELLANLERMPLQAVTPWQINAQLSGARFPEGISFQVRSGSVYSPGASGQIRATAPEAIPMTAVSQPGLLLAAAVYPGTKTLADSARPAAAGDVLEIYSLGLGATDPVVEAGAASPAPPAHARVMPRLQIGGRDAELSFAGLVPGLAGVYQVNAKVPAGLTAGYQALRWVAADGTATGTSGIYVR